MGQVTNFGFGSCPRTTPRVTLAVNGVARARRARSRTGRRGGTSSALDGRRGAVFLVGDVLAPLDGAARVVGLLHRYVGHEAVRGGPVPVVLARLEEDALARADNLGISAATLAEAHALGDVDGLPEWVSVPRGPRARREVDAGGPEAGRLRGRGEGVDVYRAGEPLVRPGSGLGRVPDDLHVVLLIGWDRLRQMRPLRLGACPRPYQGWLAGPTVNSLMVVSSGWSIAIATTLAIRSGEIWYRSYVSRICSAVSSWLIMPSSSVLIAAGQIVAVRMFVPSMADSIRRTSMKSRTNHFVPPYTAPPGYALSPATDEVVTTCPDFCPMNVGSTAATPLRTPLTFTSTVWRQSSVCSADRGEFGMIPAFRKMTSTPPNLSVARLTRASLSLGLVTSNSW